eukprot:CAMPEP_0119312700 /NCGR_PEP_ID=MMETSP1333-20130426/26960_1 /TAXON_ID=418940 /ORGANISM="Scyphosphaera apsteinii, Strain RCC1455" /LENGTH=142 /DNA_ID=CAMNT_0007317357 /DNA_START=39 /DNA_END=467 /DNA_ORIENTATION=-
MQAAQMEHKGWLVAAESQQRLLLQPDEAMEVGRVFAGAMLRRNAPREVCDAIATISRRHLEVQFCPRSGCAAIVVCSDNGIRLERFRASTVELGNGKVERCDMAMHFGCAPAMESAIPSSWCLWLSPRRVLQLLTHHRKVSV